MCDLGIALGLMSTAIGAAGSMQQAQAQADAANYNAQVAEMNAQIAEKRSKDAFDRGQKEEQEKAQEVSQLLGRQRAAMAASGQDIGYGSALDVLASTGEMGELDKLTIRSNTAREAWNYDVEAENSRSEGRLHRMQAKAATTGGYLNAFGTMIGGFGKAYGQGKKAGYFG